MSRNQAKAVDPSQAPARRAPLLADVKDGRCPKCGARALAKISGEADLNCIICGVVVYGEAAAVMGLDQVA
ncbi:MAG: hypothetical protein EPO21_10710 [Chloroflexota bacterium]|nr:MAG: hypothetical protein EPO21_10710 [Chloroflexota bacterium]